MSLGSFGAAGSSGNHFHRVDGSVLSYLTYSFGWPVYSFCCMDEFIWANTCLVISESKNKNITMIPLKNLSVNAKRRHCKPTSCSRAPPLRAAIDASGGNPLPS
ncbi:hypothetical protein B0H13DRAFT_1932350 [Mycena leptocephala]|nr:hypothetical protein B0H13DRAFT_1932350 [Mycena leptocephala]